MFLQYHLQTDKGIRINHLTFAFWSLKVLIFRMLSSCWTLLMIQFSTQSNKQTLRVINCGRRLTSLPRFCSSLSRSYWGWSLYSWWKQAQMKYERSSAATFCLVTIESCYRWDFSAFSLERTRVCPALATTAGPVCGGWCTLLPVDTTLCITSLFVYSVILE